MTLDEIWEHRDYLHALCRRIVGDDATADDVAQETCIRALQRLDELEPGPPLRAWLATVARRRSIDELRRRGRHAVPVERLPEASDSRDLLDAVTTRDALGIALEAIDALHPRERRLLWGQVVEGRTVAELADDDGSTRRAVESVLLRARTKVAAAVERGALVVAPLRYLRDALRRRAVARHMAAQHPCDDAAPSLQVAGRLPESITAGAAVIAVVASMLVGGGAPGATRVETSTPADVSLPGFGTNRADQRAEVAGSAAPREARTLADAVGAILGIPADHEANQEPSGSGRNETRFASRGAGWRGAAIGSGGTGPGRGGTTEGGGSAEAPQPRHGGGLPELAVAVAPPSHGSGDDVPAATAPSTDVGTATVGSEGGPDVAGGLAPQPSDGITGGPGSGGPPRQIPCPVNSAGMCERVDDTCPACRQDPRPPVTPQP